MTTRGIGYDEALALLLAYGAERRLPMQRVGLGEAAGRILAEDIRAPIALPSFDNSAMDGFAVRADDLSADDSVELALIGEQFAGAAAEWQMGEGECVRVTTGAAIPHGADSIVIKENAEVIGDRVRIAGRVQRGTHVRFAAEDVHVAERIAQAGERLTAPALGLLAALGIGAVEVIRKPTVAVLTTGDELRAPGQPLRVGEIYDSNRPMLMALLTQAGFDPVAWPRLPDDAGALRAALTQAAEVFDLVLTCGGVSAGERDLLPGLVAELGEIVFWKIRMKPGMPVLCGRIGQAMVLGLPGNPVSVLATATQLALPLLDALQGSEAGPRRLHARLAHPVDKKHARLEFRRARAYVDRTGVLLAHPNPADGSHRLHAAAVSNALIVLPEGPCHYATGETVEIAPYGPMLGATDAQ